MNICFFNRADCLKVIRFFKLIFTTTFCCSSIAIAGPFSWPDFKTKHVDPFISKSTDKTSGLILLSGTLAVAATHAEDDYIRTQWRGNQKIDKDTSHVGDLLGTGGFSLLASGLQYAYDDREHVYQSHLRGFFYGGISIYTLKTVFGRPRPGGSNNRQSFPSGHTGIMFMSAAHLQNAYGWGVGSAAYALSTLSAASRLTDDVHWFSDIVGGAFLGIWVGRASFYDHKNLDSTFAKLNSENFVLIPVVAASSAGLFLDYRF